jgi:hypothetical protein
MNTRIYLLPIGNSEEYKPPVGDHSGAILGDVLFALRHCT